MKIYYRRGEASFEPGFRSNGDEYRRLTDFMSSEPAVTHVDIESGTSPEGTPEYNRLLSEERSRTALSLLSSLGADSAIISVSSKGIDWRGLYAMVATSIYNNIPWWLLEQDFFPDLRVSKINIVYSIAREGSDSGSLPGSRLTHVTQLLPPATTMVNSFLAQGRTLYQPRLALRTNLLYDALAVPNIGLRLYVGRGWTVGADGYYAWWSKNDMSRIWRVQGAELSATRHFGKQNMHGWFAGAYAQILRYDILTGASGSLSGGSGTGFFNHPTLGAGIMAGYSLGLGRHLALDFTIGAGYLTGRYQKYSHINGENVWKATLTRRYFGPTKAEIALVWFIGKGGGR